MTTLTPRQQEVKKLANKKTVAEISQELGITKNAVYGHLRRIKAAADVDKATHMTTSMTVTTQNAVGASLLKTELTPLEAIRRRRAQIGDEIVRLETVARQAAAEAERADAEVEKARAAVARELDVLTKAEMALAELEPAVADEG